jgi:uncharacterized membrane protein
MNRKMYWILLIVSFGVMMPFVAPYLTLNPENSRVAVTSTAVQYPALVGHIGFALLAMAAGFVQLSAKVRRNRPELHRRFGQVYAASVMISGLLALVVVLYVGDFAKAVYFLVLSVFWLFTCWKGYRAAVRRRMEEHRIWMIRSFGITLAAASARLLVPALLLLYAFFHGFVLPGGREQMVKDVLNVNIWFGLVLNMAVVEWGIIRGRTRAPELGDRGGK